MLNMFIIFGCKYYTDIWSDLFLISCVLILVIQKITSVKVQALSLGDPPQSVSKP